MCIDRGSCDWEPYRHERLELPSQTAPRHLHCLGEWFEPSDKPDGEPLREVLLESELWLSDANKPTGDDAVADGILIWDCFGLPVSRAEYTEANIKTVAFRCHENMEKLMELI